MLTTVTGTTADSELTTNGTAAQKVDTLDEAAVLLLPGSIFAPYEALAVRLKAAAPGTTLPVHVASQGAGAITVGESVQENIQTLARLINARRTRITLERPGGLPPLDAEVWGDEAGRLLRVSVPAQNLDAVRDDVGSVSARHVAVVRAGDEQSGFREWVLAGGNDFEAGRCRRQTAAGHRARRWVGPDRSR